MPYPGDLPNVKLTRRHVLIAGATAPWWLPEAVGAYVQELGSSMASAAPNSPEILMAIVYGNNRGTKGLRSSWGFSCLIRGTPQTILFDTAQHASSLAAPGEQDA